MLELVGSRHPSKALLTSSSKAVQIQESTVGGTEQSLASPLIPIASTVGTMDTGVKPPRKKQYIFKGECNALAVQLFAIEDKYETRFDSAAKFWPLCC